MKKEDIKFLCKLYMQFENEVKNVFNELNKNNLLDFYNNSIESIDIDENTENTICITYYDSGYDLYDCSGVNIPTDILGDDNKISDYIKNLKEEKEWIEKIENERKLKAEKEYRRKKYEELRQEFEND